MTHYFVVEERHEARFRDLEGRRRVFRHAIYKDGGGAGARLIFRTEAAWFADAICRNLNLNALRDDG